MLSARFWWKLYWWYAFCLTCSIHFALLIPIFINQDVFDSCQPHIRLDQLCMQHITYVPASMCFWFTECIERHWKEWTKHKELFHCLLSRSQSQFFYQGFWPLVMLCEPFLHPWVALLSAHSTYSSQWFHAIPVQTCYNVPAKTGKMTAIK